MEDLATALGEKIGDLLEQCVGRRPQSVAGQGPAEILVADSLGVRLGLYETEEDVAQQAGVIDQPLQELALLIGDLQQVHLQKLHGPA